MEMCLITLKLSRNLIKCHINLSKTFYTTTCNTTLHSPTTNNLTRLKQLFINTTPCQLNLRLISTSCVMQRGHEKGEKKKSIKAQRIDLNESRDVLNIDKFMNQMNHTIEELRSNFVKHLTLRSSAGSINQVVVNFEGDEYILQDLVQIVYKPKMIVLNAIDFPQAIPDILKALSQSGMNLNPQQDGTTLFIPIPKVTKEYREGLAKNAKALYIRSRDNLKDIKNKEIKTLKKIPSLPEDQVRRIQAQLEALCDEYIKQAENILNTKQKELLKSSD